MLFPKARLLATTSNSIFLKYFYQKFQKLRKNSQQFVFFLKTLAKLPLGFEILFRIV